MGRVSLFFCEIQRIQVAEPRRLHQSVTAGECGCAGEEVGWEDRPLAGRNRDLHVEKGQRQGPGSREKLAPGVIRSSAYLIMASPHPALSQLCTVKNT